MKRYVAVRVIKALLTVLFVWTVVFILSRVTGDPVDWMLQSGGDMRAREQLRHNLGLDLPLAQQYFRAIAGMLTGDAGTSFYYARPVSDLFAERMTATLTLGAVVFGVTILFGVPLGVFAALRHNSVLDRLTMGFSVAGYTVPNFVLGILLIFIFSLHLKLLPSGSVGTPAHFVLPVIAMSVAPAANVARLTRSALLDVIGQDFLECARAKGAKESRVIFKHALRNALISVVTILGAQLGYIIGGSVVVETVFAWPGIGTLIVNSAKQRDFPVVQFGVMIICISVTAINLLVDLSYSALDPRIRGRD
ncbi:peptide/nickel transport system permease protein [Sporobacter termitidis DSM 10068]|uniref:Peptide/nickel transport system permease protein n=1 Tax=Sporobacter termitidis DSM 10068 TaxID=1123282 RepID=A0A1M5XBL2_9FIRM|nr:ABC transporter permease [Sporobacter termitidis]SHH97210.1 peptide/nickel transport system permease protein [Sporobacter termitidis DSM 10068]